MNNLQKDCVFKTNSVKLYRELLTIQKGTKWKQNFQIESKR